MISFQSWCVSFLQELFWENLTRRACYCSVHDKEVELVPLIYSWVESNQI